MLHGKAMSYNNYVDADAARRAAYDFAEPCVAIIKHSNPCGIAIGADIADAYAKALACDPLSAYGGVVAANGTVTARWPTRITESSADVVIAPDFDARRSRSSPGSGRTSGCCADAPVARSEKNSIEFRQVSGGLLAADRRTRSTLPATTRGGGS